MRISDWSSDVCSSDLKAGPKIARTWQGDVCRRNNRPFFPLVCWSPRPYFACQRPGSRYRRETWPTMIMTTAAVPIGAALLAATACPIRPLAAYMAAAEAKGRSSEERRVGKECVSQCGSRWSSEHYKNKKKTIIQTSNQKEQRK